MFGVPGCSGLGAISQSGGLPQDNPPASNALRDLPAAQPRTVPPEKRSQRLFAPDRSGVLRGCVESMRLDGPSGREKRIVSRSFRSPERRVASCMEAFAEYLRATLRRELSADRFSLSGPNFFGSITR